MEGNLHYRGERLVLEELEAAGIETSAYNLPDWEETREGLARRLDQLFQFTPPTAFIFQEPALLIAARNHLADRGIPAPRDVSLMVTEHQPYLDWYTPEFAHIRWDHRPVVRRIVRWARGDGWKTIFEDNEDRKASSGSWGRFTGIADGRFVAGFRLMP